MWEHWFIIHQRNLTTILKFKKWFERNQNYFSKTPRGGPQWDKMQRRMCDTSFGIGQAVIT